MQKKIIVCGDKSYPPFEFVNDDGVFQGFNVELMNELGKVLAMETIFKPVLWKQAVDLVHRGKADAIQGYIMLSGRTEHLQFSRDYLTVSYGVFTLRDNEDIQNVQDLNQKKVAVQRGDFSVDLVRTIILTADYKKQLVFTETQEQAVQCLIDREVDCVIGNQLTVSYITEKMGLSGMIKTLSPPLAPRKYAIAVNKNNNELLKKLNEGITSLINQGTHSQLIKKWFGEVSYENYISGQAYSAGVITLNSLGIVNSINNNAEKLLKIKADDVLGEHFLETDIIKWVKAEIVQQCLLTNSFHFELETQVKKQKKAKQLYYNISPMYDQHTNQEVGALISFSALPLIGQVKQDDLHQNKMYSLGRILTGLAHDIRTPLTAIKSFTQTLANRYDDSEFLTEFMHYVPAEIERLERLVTDILVYANPQKRLPEIINLNRIIDSVVNILKNQFSNSGAIRVEIDSALDIYGNADNIKQIFFNLLLNAIESFTEQGEIIIRGIKKEDVILIRISDNGPGIPLENMYKVFEPFFTTKPQGTGLGLFLTYNLLRVNNGKITLRSKVGSGTEVEIIFEKVVHHEENTNY